MRWSPPKNPAQRRPVCSPGLYHHTAPGRKGVISLAHVSPLPSPSPPGPLPRGSWTLPKPSDPLGQKHTRIPLEPSSWVTEEEVRASRGGGVATATAQVGGCAAEGRWPLQTGQGSGKGLPHQPFQSLWPWLPAGPAPHLGWKHWPLSETSFRTKNSEHGCTLSGPGASATRRLNFHSASLVTQGFI